MDEELVDIFKKEIFQDELAKLKSRVKDLLEQKVKQYVASSLKRIQPINFVKELDINFYYFEEQLAVLKAIKTLALEEIGRSKDSTEEVDGRGLTDRERGISPET